MPGGRRAAAAELVACRAPVVIVALAAPAGCRGGRSSPAPAGRPPAAPAAHPQGRPLVISVAVPVTWQLARDDGGTRGGERTVRPMTAPPRGSYAVAPEMTFSGAQLSRSAPGSRMRLSGRTLGIAVAGVTPRRFVVAAAPAALPRPAEPTLVTARVEIPRSGQSGSGVFCRGTVSSGALDDGYALVVKPSGLWMLFRVVGGQHRLLGRTFLPAAGLSPAGAATVVQLSCERQRPARTSGSSSGPTALVTRSSRSPALPSPGDRCRRAARSASPPCTSPPQAARRTYEPMR